MTGRRVDVMGGEKCKMLIKKKKHSGIGVQGPKWLNHGQWGATG